MPFIAALLWWYRVSDFKFLSVEKQIIQQTNKQTNKECPALIRPAIYTGCPTRYQTRHFFNNSNTNEDTAMKQTHYRHTLQTRTTDTHYRHALQTRTTHTHYRHTLHTLQTRTTDTHYKHALQTRTTDTHYRHILHTLQTRTTDTHYRHTLQTHTTDTFLFISHTTNVLLFKFRCNILIGVRIIKEMPGSVSCGTPV
jgi:hypothetical protein